MNRHDRHDDETARRIALGDVRGHDHTETGLERMAREALETRALAEAATGPIRVLAVSLDGKQPAKLYAMHDDERGGLAVVSVSPLQGPLSAWKGDLLAEIRQRMESGYVVVAEDRGGFISDGVPSLDLEATLPTDGRVLAYVALDQYFAMVRTETIRFHDTVKRYQFRESQVEPEPDEKGRTKYHVDWGTFTAASRAVLLAVLAVKREPMSARYIEEYFAGFRRLESEASAHPAGRMADALFPGWREWRHPWREPY